MIFVVLWLMVLDWVCWCVLVILRMSIWIGIILFCFCYYGNFIKLWNCRYSEMSSCFGLVFVKFCDYGCFFMWFNKGNFFIKIVFYVKFFDKWGVIWSCWMCYGYCGELGMVVFIVYCDLVFFCWLIFVVCLVY